MLLCPFQSLIGKESCFGEHSSKWLPFFVCFISLTFFIMSGWSILFILLFVIYFLPTLIAIMNSNRAHRFSAIFVNIFLGWSVIGWIVALILAMKEKQHEVVIVQQIVNNKEEEKRE